MKKHRSRTRRFPSLRGPELFVLAALALASPNSGSAANDSARIQHATVRLVSHSQRANWYAPWEALSPTESSGSGFVIEGGRILTNAHVVSDARLILAYLNGDPTPHEVEVRFIGHDCDLALLVPVEPGLLAKVPALAFAGLPQLGSTVETYGYPAGGQQISSTRGVVSRIEASLYSHSGIDQLLTVQTDAAINPGNSGGPVIQRGRVIGVAFQARPDLENVGFVIPTEVVERFMIDVSDGRYEGYAALGAVLSKLENPAARQRAGLRPGETGVRVDFVWPKSSADGRLEPGDVILRVDDYVVANDETIERDGLRLHVGVLVDRHQVGSTLHVKVLRDGRRREVEVPLARYEPMRRYTNYYDQLPRYYVYAGLVFVPLSLETLKTLGEDWASRSDSTLLYEYFERIFQEPERLLDERVVLLRRLDHAVNADIVWHQNLVVERVNGRAIRSLEQLIEAIESNAEPYHVLELAYFDRFIVLDREAANRAHPLVLERYAVSADRRL